jgi:DNA helicase II / ATP-dependent DNA helicase PcrA
MPLTINIKDLWAADGFRPNTSQEEAIRHTSGPLFLTAGPGSGKTRVLLWRTVNLIVFEEVRPEEIFLSTFTESAFRSAATATRASLARRIATTRSRRPPAGSSCSSAASSATL